MKFLLAQPAVPRFQWELEVLLTNLKQFGDHEVVLLFSKHDDTVPQYLANKYDGVQCFVYEDTRDYMQYIPSIRPFLLWRYFSSEPSRSAETYFYIDSDVIFRELPHFATLVSGGKEVVGSNCDSYIGLDYILGAQKGQEIAERMAKICGITVDQMVGVPGIGAQLFITGLDADFWLQAYRNSNEIYRYFQTVDSNIQKWTAEMWAQLWGWVRVGAQISMPKEMDFCMATDPIARWNETKIMHNAGVLDTSTDMFFKGRYSDKKPFGEDFSFVDPNKVSAKYVEAVQNVVL